jgi:antitoxin VapB
MPLSIKDPDADRLARALAQRTGETLTEAVINALRERLERELRKDQSIENLIEDVMEIGRHCAALPLLDRRRPDDILGYDKNGLPRSSTPPRWSQSWTKNRKRSGSCVAWLPHQSGYCRLRIWSRWES